jgi:hypothetical protein
LGILVPRRRKLCILPKNQIKLNKEVKDKEPTNMESLHRIIKKLMIEVVDLKKNIGEVFGSRNPFKPWKKNTNQRHPSPSIIGGINFETYAIDHFRRSHHENHSEKTCRDFKNMLKVFFSPPTKEKE